MSDYPFQIAGYVGDSFADNDLFKSFHECLIWAEKNRKHFDSFQVYNENDKEFVHQFITPISADGPFDINKLGKSDGTLL